MVPLFIPPNIQESVLATFPQADAHGRNTHSCHFSFVVQREWLLPPPPLHTGYTKLTPRGSLSHAKVPTQAPARSHTTLAVAKVSRAAAGTVYRPPPPLSLFFRSVRGLPRRPSATFFPSVQSLRGPATLELRGSHAWGGGGGVCQKVSEFRVRTDARAWVRAALEGAVGGGGGSPTGFRVTRGPEEMGIVRCTQRRRSPRARARPVVTLRATRGPCGPLCARRNCGRSRGAAESPYLQKFPRPGRAVAWGPLFGPREEEEKEGRAQSRPTCLWLSGPSSLLSASWLGA